MQTADGLAPAQAAELRARAAGAVAGVAAGLVAALAVAAGVTLTALGASPERGRGEESVAVPVL
ncbi:hypothetical protein AB0K18_48555 [Nonomuraea sp. NPDC049421]|uniref:hypothetical protein n=1 Tax=Nonomuraea sp. NPDC049421 TaxID=3155275 RepID=UPI0034431452